MVYANKVAAAVKVGGKVLKEVGGTVFIPFGSEYSLLIKNLHSTRLMAKVSIDGVDVVDNWDGWLVIQPNSSLDLERYIKNGNLNSGNRFKFIERTKQIEDHKGIGVEDGLIRIEYKPEKQKPVTKVTDHYVDRYHYNDHYYDWDYWYPYPRPYRYHQPYIGWSSGMSGQLTVAVNTNDTGFSRSSAGVMNVNCANTSSSGPMFMGAMKCSATPPGMDSVPYNDVGITVPGSQSNQQFSLTNSFDTDPSYVLVLNLRGTSPSGVPVSSPVLVSRKTTCKTCGTKNYGVAKFCSNCGTAVDLF